MSTKNNIYDFRYRLNLKGKPHSCELGKLIQSFMFTCVWENDFSPHNLEHKYFDIKILGSICEQLEKVINIPHNGFIGISFVKEEKIKNLNSIYRGKERVTDVLSFHYYNVQELKNLSMDDCAGEIILCSQKIISQSQEYRHSQKEEVYRLVIHSLLHILGFDHETDKEYLIMFAHEKNLIFHVNHTFGLNICI